MNCSTLWFLFLQEPLHFPSFPTTSLWSVLFSIFSTLKQLEYTPVRRTAPAQLVGPAHKKWKIFSAQIQSTVVVLLKKVDQKRRFSHSIVIKALNKQNKERILKTTRVNSQVDYKDKPKKSHSTTQ